MEQEIWKNWAKKYKPLNRYFQRHDEFHSVYNKNSEIYKASLENRVWTFEGKPGITIAHPGIVYANNPLAFSCLICEIPYKDGEQMHCVGTWNITVP